MGIRPGNPTRRSKQILDLIPNMITNIKVATVIHDHRYGTETYTFFSSKGYEAFMAARLQDFLEDIGTYDFEIDSKEFAQLIENDVNEAWSIAEREIGDGGCERSAFGYYTYEVENAIHDHQELLPIIDLIDLVQDLCKQPAYPRDKMKKALKPVITFLNDNNKL